MRHIRTTPALVLALTMTGCMSSPRPARTEITPGESEIISERDERRPSESTMRIRTVIPQAPAPEPAEEAPVRIRIILPKE